MNIVNKCDLKDWNLEISACCLKLKYIYIEQISSIHCDWRVVNNSPKTMKKKEKEKKANEQKENFWLRLSNSWSKREKQIRKKMTLWNFCSYSCLLPWYSFCCPYCLCVCLCASLYFFAICKSFPMIEYVCISYCALLPTFGFDHFGEFISLKHRW